MKRFPLRDARVFIIGLMMLLIPAMAQAQSEQYQAGPPPIGQQLVREGDFAVRLQSALGVGSAEDEVEAESLLAEFGVMPRNGWIADYPVTPDIIGELYQAVSDAVDAGKLPLGKDEALKRLGDVVAEFGLGVTPYTAAKPAEGKAPDSGSYPAPTTINNYYYAQGPPVVTYYAPPPDFYYMYAWVPFPFWSAGFWFPGFFILHDFHRTVIVKQRVVFVSNHFNDVRGHRVFRIDPVKRFRGRTFAGIGVTRTQEFIPTGIPRSDRQIFNDRRTRIPPGSRIMTAPPRRGGGVVAPTSPERRTITPRPRGEQTITPPSRGEQRIIPPSRSGRGGGKRSGEDGGVREKRERR